jgi:nucleoside-diphosphate-sugar epimerase
MRTWNSPAIGPRCCHFISSQKLLEYRPGAESAITPVEPMRILVTGATGFIGSMLCVRLAEAAHEVIASSRSLVEQPGIFYVASPELGPAADWTPALSGIDTVVHLAGRAHVTAEQADAKTEQAYFRINTEGTRALAAQSTAAGVKHFIFLSSCHAIAGESDDVLTERTVPRPVTAYGRSKLAAEEAIKSVLADSDCAWTILRPPLVYGPGNKANFGLLVKLVKTGLPLPLASVRNRRSFIYVENLVDLISKCLGNAKAFGKVYLPSDGEDLSTAQLIEKIARAETRDLKPECDGDGCVAARGARLFPFPPSLLKAAGRCPGLGSLRKLTSSLYVDSGSIRRDLGWTPPFTMEEGLRRTLAS